MQDLVMVLDNREIEINQFIATSNEEREKLINRLNEIDNSLQDANRDLHRISKARKELLNSDEAEMRLANTVGNVLPPTAQSQFVYRPGQ